MEKLPLRSVVASYVKQEMKSHPELDTQEKLAKKAGVAQSHISRLLRGQNVTLDILEKVARALNKEPFELIIKNDAARLALLGRIFGNDAPSDAETVKILKIKPPKGK